MNPEIIPIFPTPIYKTNLSRIFSNEELFFVDEIKKETHKNYGNLNSLNTYILNNLIFKELKDELTSHINNFFNTIINPKYDPQLYITQSWLNYTKEKEFHHIHSHHNSIVSGVLYINADKNNDEITFLKKNFNEIQVERKNDNPYNANTCNFTVETGNLLLFPSSLDHWVSAKKGTNTRISLAFNTFIKGKIGEENSLTELFL
jgi:uncharacterized protein (TIGR02466 family)